MPRIACLFVPLFALAARVRAEPQLVGAAVVVCEGNGSAARVAAASRTARQAGLELGMTLAQARSILPDVIARGRDATSERSAHEALLEVAWSLSPRVESAAEDLLFADVSGMGRLFPGPEGEAEMAHHAMRTAEKLGLYVRLGVAANKLAARVAAHSPPSPRIVAAGAEADFLAPLPLERIGLDRRLRQSLERWGIGTIGELARLPADRVASRLGPVGAAAHLSARGVDPQPLVPLHPPPTLDEGMELEWAVVTLEPLLYALEQSLERLCERLAHHDLACALLELELALEPEGSDRHSLRLPAPTREAQVLLSLSRVELEGRPPSAPVAAFRCVAHPDRPRRGQLTLFGAPEIHPDQLATTLARLAARLGPDRVASPRLVDGHRPERYATGDFDPPPPPRIRRDPGRGRGLLSIRALRPPVPLEVITEAIKNYESRSIKNDELRIKNDPLPHKESNRRGGVYPRPTSDRNSDRNSDSGKSSGSALDYLEGAASGHGHGHGDGHGHGHGDDDGHRSGGPLLTSRGARSDVADIAGPTSPTSDQAPACRIERGAEIVGTGTGFDDGHGLRLVSVTSASGATPRIQGLVRVAAGPWQLEEGWWSDEPTAREYWDVELSGGGLYRIFRDASDGEWYADGMYD